MAAITANTVTMICEALPSLLSPKRVSIHSDPVIILDFRIQTAKNIIMNIWFQIGHNHINIKLFKPYKKRIPTIQAVPETSNIPEPLLRPK